MCVSFSVSAGALSSEESALGVSGEAEELSGSWGSQSKGATQLTRIQCLGLSFGFCLMGLFLSSYLHISQAANNNYCNYSFICIFIIKPTTNLNFSELAIMFCLVRRPKTQKYIIYDDVVLLETRERSKNITFNSPNQ